MENKDLDRVKGRDFRFLEIIGQGSYAKVWKAQRGQNFYALKELNIHPSTNFASEFALLTQLKHPHLIRGESFFFREKKIYLVMELAQDSLANLVPQKHLSEQDIYNYFYQLLSALHYLHENRLVHLDVKPQNCLFISGQVKLADFGLISHIDQSLEGYVFPSSAPPEFSLPPSEVRGTGKTLFEQKKDPRQLDIWGAGLILAFLLKEAPLFSAHKGGKNSFYQYLEQPEKFLSSLKLEKKWTSLLYWILNPRVHLRPQSISEIIGALSYPLPEVTSFWTSSPQGPSISSRDERFSLAQEWLKEVYQNFSFHPRASRAAETLFTYLYPQITAQGKRVFLIQLLACACLFLANSLYSNSNSLTLEKLIWLTEESYSRKELLFLIMEVLLLLRGRIFFL